MISPSPHSIFLKSVFYKSNLENPSAIEIFTIGTHTLGKQKGSEDETISIVYIKHGAQSKKF